MEKDIDVLQQYKNIANKLKKKFLKKPNVSEGSGQFGSLARQMKSEDSPHYAGLCFLAQARCEHTLGNWCTESHALLEAARSFMLAEKDIQETMGPSFYEHLNAGINCYSHAIRVYLENNQYILAASICMEGLNKSGQSIQHYQRAVELLQPHPLECLDAMEALATVKLNTKDYDGALSTYTEMYYLALEKGPRCFGGTGFERAVADILATCEVNRLLLLLLLQPTPQRTRPEHAKLLEKY
ncbi:hypothetical protein HELRODRAFT_91677, partial [Helobdella robusta]|uniref:Factor VIII intron 22 protein n=1 Tax=Helobdella robusta TaxID=6412 RepID=T1G876_HELRO